MVFFFATSKRSLKKNVRIPEKKTKWRSIGKETSTDFSFKICVDFQKNARVYSCSENGKDFLYVVGRDVGDEVPVCTIKKHTIYPVRQWVLLNISLPMK